MSEWTIWKRIKRRVSVGNGLRFDYEVSPHRAFLDKAQSVNDGTVPSQTPPSNDRPSILVASVLETSTPKMQGTGNVGDFVPFKQSRLKGTVNPLRPPLHVETVSIGRALGQPTGYLFGVGFRVRDDGYVEAEFVDGVRKFDTYKKFEIEVTDLIGRINPTRADTR
jgi:hypothetical protein